MPLKSKLSPQSHGPSTGFIVLLAGIGILVHASPLPAPQPSAPPQPPVTRAVPPKPDRAVRAEFFVQHVDPVIQSIDEANREAADRCVERMNDAFDKYRRGVNPFVEDMTSWGTRWGVLRRMPADWWNDRNDVRHYVGKKFEKHLFSEKTLRRDIQVALTAYRKDIEANNVTLLTSIQAAASTTDLAKIPPIDHDVFSRDVKKSLQTFAGNAAVDNVHNFVIIEIVSGVGGLAAERLLLAIAARLVTMAATTSVSAGGATAGSAAAGGAGGSLAGPIGTGIGLVVGIAAGVIIDWWMSEDFKDKLDGQLNRMIDQIELSVIKGSKRRPGLARALSEARQGLREAHRKSLYKRIVGEPIQ